MSRIISGLAGSLRLYAASSQTRPTSDRVKESVFASLESMGAIENARVLDLFAGSAALGLEALSRGASSLTLVEKSRQAFEVCKKNKELFEIALSHQQVRKHIELKNTDAHNYLKSSEEIFDLVFIDPPYDFADEKIARLLVELRPLLSKEAVVVLERGKQSNAAYERFDVVNQKGYGDTSVFFLRPISQ